jgi:hypothetical protein
MTLPEQSEWTVVKPSKQQFREAPWLSGMLLLVDALARSWICV